MSHKFVRPKGPVAKGDEDVQLVTDAGFEHDYPALWEYLTMSRWEDGSVRETATLTFFHEEGLWKACLNDRANVRSGWASGATYREVIGRIEAGLAEDKLDWRRNKPRGRPGPRRE